MKSRFVAALATALVMAAPQLAQAQFMDIVQIIGGIGGTKFLRDADRASDASGLRVVRLSSLAGAELNAGRMGIAREMKALDIAYLQGNLILNPMAMTAIRNSGYILEQMVSVDIARDGGGVIYADDLFY